MQRTISSSRRSKQDQNPDNDMFISHLKESTPRVNGQSELRHLFAYDPSRTRHLLQFTQAVMRAPGPLSSGERELVAAMTSRSNHCLF
jgi:alkylhydroperoxidase family enzyme